MKGIGLEFRHEIPIFSEMTSLPRLPCALVMVMLLFLPMLCRQFLFLFVIPQARPIMSQAYTRSSINSYGHNATPFRCLELLNFRVITTHDLPLLQANNIHQLFVVGYHFVLHLVSFNMAVQFIEKLAGTLDLLFFNAA